MQETSQRQDSSQETGRTPGARHRSGSFGVCLSFCLRPCVALRQSSKSLIEWGVASINPLKLKDIPALFCNPGSRILCLSQPSLPPARKPIPPPVRVGLRLRALCRSPI